MRESLVVLGQAIKARRRERGMTLQDVAKRTGLSSGLLSQVENFRTIPSLPVLLAIAAALDVEAAELLRAVSTAAKTKCVRIRADERRPVEREEARGVSYHLLLERPLAASTMQIMVVRFAADAVRQRVVSDGEQLIYILSGGLRYDVDGELWDLAAGDLLFFDGRLPHGPSAMAAEGAELLAIYFLRLDA